MTKYKLYYFNMRGRAEIIRLIFAAADQEYEDVRFEHAQWPQLKAKYEFGQVPVLEVDGHQFNQSNAIAHYLAQQFGLAGKTDTDALQCHALNDSIRDLFDPWGSIMWEPDAEKKQKATQQFIEVTAKQYLQNFEKFCAKHMGASGFLVADRLTYADLTLFHGLSTLQEQVGDAILDPYPTVKKHQAIIGSLPCIKEYLAKRPKTLL